MDKLKLTTQNTQYWKDNILGNLNFGIMTYHEEPIVLNYAEMLNIKLCNKNAFQVVNRANICYRGRSRSVEDYIKSEVLRIHESKIGSIVCECVDFDKLSKLLANDIIWYRGMIFDMSLSN